LTVLTGFFDASMHVELHRLPELFCGFPRSLSTEGPIRYPTACAPQAWASATPFSLLAACLGVTFDASNGCIHFRRPVLPPFPQDVQIRNLTLGNASVDIVCRRHPHNVSVNIMDRRGDIDVLVTK
jgi:glycogen debranching enzyme